MTEAIDRERSRLAQDIESTAELLPKLALFDDWTVPSDGADAARAALSKWLAIAEIDCTSADIKVLKRCRRRLARLRANNDDLVQIGNATTQSLFGMHVARIRQHRDRKARRARVDAFISGEI